MPYVVVERVKRDGKGGEVMLVVPLGVPVSFKDTYFELLKATLSTTRWIKEDTVRYVHHSELPEAVVRYIPGRMVLPRIPTVRDCPHDIRWRTSVDVVTFFDRQLRASAFMYKPKGCVRPSSFAHLPKIVHGLLLREERQLLPKRQRTGPGHQE